MQLFGSVLYGADELVSEFVRARIPHAQEFGFGPCKALGVVRGDKLLGGVVFHNFRGHDLEMSGAFDRADWIRPSTLRHLFSFPFGQLGCARMTTITGRKNKRARKLDEFMGFRVEGVIRKGLDGKEDCIVYGMLREECRWLKGN